MSDTHIILSQPHANLSPSNKSLFYYKGHEEWQASEFLTLGVEAGARAFLPLLSLRAGVPMLSMSDAFVSLKMFCNVNKSLSR